MTELTSAHLTLLGRVADVLMSGPGEAPVPTQLSNFSHWIERAIQARCRNLAAVTTALDEIDLHDVPNTLRQMELTRKEQFELIAAIAVGAYTMHPDVMAALGYPTTRRAPIRLEQSANELSSGILDPVLNSTRALLRDAPD